MCNWRYNLTQTENMNLMHFLKIIDDCINLGLEKVVFGATGETLLHPDFPYMISYLKSKNIKSEIVTNMTIFNPDIKNTLLKMDKITVSIDGASKETYERIRVGANFDDVLDNLFVLSKEKSDNTILDVNYVISSDNYKEVFDFITLTKRYVDAINFKFINSTTDETNGLRLSYQTIFDILNKLKDKELVKISNPEELRTYIHKIPCYNLWFGCYISPSGKVYPCCNFYDEDKNYLGDLNTQSMKDIWNSNKYNDLRKEYKGKKPNLCEHCPGDNKKVHEMVLKLPLHKILIGV